MMLGSKLAILAGGGQLAVEVAAAAAAAGQPLFVIGIEGEAEAALDQFPSSRIRLGQIGRLMQLLRDEKCQELVIIGSVRRPDLRKIGLDFGALLTLPLIFRLMVGGDEGMLTRIVGFFEQRGFRVRGAHEIAPHLVASAGVLGRHRPSRRDQADIALGMTVTHRLGELDVGQGAVVARGHVLAVEAAEGTDQMLARCGALRQWGRQRSGRRMGVFVKRPRPGQELRIDMPAIGPQTIARAAEAGLAGIAVEAGGVLLAERADLIAAADAAGLFLIGVAVKD